MIIGRRINSSTVEKNFNFKLKKKNKKNIRYNIV